MSAVSLQTSTSYPLSSDESSYSNNNQAPQLRPKVIRRETDNILSYYQSEHAGRTYLASDAGDSVSAPSLMREASSDSHSSSEYSSDSLDRHVDTLSHAANKELPSESSHTRRPSVPSERGADRRRLAIVELDSTAPLSVHRKRSQRANEPETEPRGGSMTSATIHTRRGIHVDGLALVAPPDASPRTYTDLTPPSTAPLFTDRDTTSSHSVSHQRSISEATHVTSRSRLHHQSSRDIGIVGMVSSVPEVAEPETSIGSEYQGHSSGEGLRVPVFQTPADSRSPSPDNRATVLSGSSPAGLHPTFSHNSLPTPDQLGIEQQVSTPAVGEYKEISQPVVGPVTSLASDAIRRDQGRNITSVPPNMRAASTVPSHASSSPYSSRATSSYRYYEPGTHSIAGPPPPPPEPIPLFDPDVHVRSPSIAPPRPPRLHGPLFTGPGHDMQAIKEALQLPKSVSAALAHISPPDSPKRSSAGLSKEIPESAGEHEEARPSNALSSSRSIHRREGAFPPSTICPSLSTPISVKISEPDADDPRSPMQTDEESILFVKSVSQKADASNHAKEAYTSSDHTLSARRSGLELRRESSWVSLSQEAIKRTVSPNGGAEILPDVSIAGSSTSSVSATSPTPPPKSIKGSEDERTPGSNYGGNTFKATLTNLKRFSALPRTPSTMSVTKSPSLRQSRTPSPSVIPIRPPRPRIRSAWPDAMQCKDVTSKKSALERSMGYARKINELAMYDCGLGEWVQAKKHPAPSARSSATRITLTPATPSIRTHAGQPRHTSHGSMASEMTFPIRPDAYTATDLSMRPTDVVSPNTPPSTLPYPALAQAQNRMGTFRSSTMMPSYSRSLQIPLSGGKSSGGFFSSIGRKTSVKKDRSVLGPASPARVLSKRNAAANINSRPPPVQITTSPVVPGGPRAAPSKIQRSQTFSASTTPPQPDPAPPSASNSRPNRQSAVARRPSLFARARAGPVATASTVTSPDFEQQVNRLAELLPQADRNVLAGYLRRAGQDILAIGQYLEDEKNGTLRYD